MSVKITIAVCQIEVYCGFQKAAVTGLSYTQADYADMIMLLCILEANKHTYTRQTHSEVSILTSCHNKLPLADENSYYPYYNSLPLVFTLFFHFWICEVFTNSLFFWRGTNIYLSRSKTAWKNGSDLCKKEVGNLKAYFPPTHSGFTLDLIVAVVSVCLGRLKCSRCKNGQHCVGSIAPRYW